MNALGCTAGAFEDYGDGVVLFTPYGRVGTAYAARDSARMRALASAVRLFCALAGVIVGGFLLLWFWQKVDHSQDPRRWFLLYSLGAAFLLWMLAYALWAWRATRGLEKVRR